jgi:hypothetical protein
VNAISEYPFNQFGAGNYGIGYYSPPDCDGENITCSYIPKPEFRNLQIAYASTPTRGVISRDIFSPPANRLGRSKCPPNWAALDEFVWEADSLEDQWCPWDIILVCNSDGDPTILPAPTLTPNGDSVPGATTATPGRSPGTTKSPAMSPVPNEDDGTREDEDDGGETFPPTTATTTLEASTPTQFPTFELAETHTSQGTPSTSAGTTTRLASKGMAVLALFNLVLLLAM